MNLQIDPNEVGSLAQLIYGTGNSEKDQAAERQSPEGKAAVANPAGPISANTQNPIPNMAGFYNVLAGAPPEQTQPNLSLPMMSQQPQPNQPAQPQSVPVMSPQGQVPQGPDPRQLFTDPNTLLLLGASLLGRGNNETILQSAARGLLAGQEYLNAKARQGQVDQRQAALDARGNEESSARVRESNARTNASEAALQQSKDRFGLVLEADKAKLAALQQQLASAQTTDARARIQLAIDNLSLRMKEKYGDQLQQNEVDLGQARTESARATARENTAQANLTDAKAEALNSLSPEDKRRVLLGAGAKGIKDREDRYWDFVNRNARQFADPVTGAVDVDRMNEAFTKGEKVTQYDGVPQAAVKHLKNNPQLKNAFDQKYGKGAADYFLRQ